jgi:glycerol-3-phosphate dehydrogenase (NAD(P)+)
MEDVDLVVVGVNSLGVDWAAMMLGPLLSPATPVLMLTKGLAGDGKQLQILPHLVREQLPVGLQSQVQLAAVGGPSIAGELVVGRPTSVVIAGVDPQLLQQLAEMVRTPYYHVWTSTDFVGVETCVAMKNIYALAVGLVNGLLEKAGPVENEAMMHNAAAAIFAQSMGEMAYMTEYAGGRSESVLALPGAGDLYVTSMGGRNGRMGRYLGQGMLYTDAKARYMADVTIEGAELALAIGPTVENLVRAGRLDPARIPLLRSMIQIVCNDARAEIPWHKFFKGAFA